MSPFAITKSVLSFPHAFSLPTFEAAARARHQSRKRTVKFASEKIDPGRNSLCLSYI